MKIILVGNWKWYIYEKSLAEGFENINVNLASFCNNFLTILDPIKPPAPVITTRLFFQKFFILFLRFKNLASMRGQGLQNANSIPA